jgi:hypothetical protein
VLVSSAGFLKNERYTGEAQGKAQIIFKIVLLAGTFGYIQVCIGA